MLDSQGFSLVFKSENVVFKGLSGTLDDILIVDDGSLEESLSFDESLLLFLEMGSLDDPVGSLSFFSFSELVSALDELLSDLAQ